MSPSVCADAGVARGEKQCSDLNKNPLVQCCGVEGVLLERGDDRGRRRAQALLCTVWC